jgi:hypothetical protein
MCKKNQVPDRGCSSRIIIPRAWEQFFGLKKLKLVDADSDPGSGIFLNRNPGWKNSDGFGIRDRRPVSSTLVAPIIMPVERKNIFILSSDYIELLVKKAHLHLLLFILDI